MKQKGFTLIELLAVIVILAIIALIATPMILGVINTAKEGSAESAALGYIDAVEKSAVLSLFDDEAEGTATVSAGEYTVSDSGKTLTNGTSTITVTFKGDAPEAGSTVTIGEDGVITSAKLGFKQIYAYWVNYDGSKASVDKDSKIS